MKNVFKNVNIANKIQQETTQPQTIPIHNAGRYHVIKSRKGNVTTSHPAVDESIKSYDPQSSASCGRPSPNNPSTWAVQPTSLPPQTYVTPTPSWTTVSAPLPQYASNYVYQTVPTVPAVVATTVDPYSTTQLETYYNPTTYIPQHSPGMDPQIERTIIQVAPAYGMPGMVDPSQPLVFAQPMLDPYHQPESNNIPFFVPNPVVPPRFTLLQPLQSQPSIPVHTSSDEIQYQPFQQYQDYQDYGDWQAHDSPKRNDKSNSKSKDRSGSPEPKHGAMIDPSQRNTKNRGRKEKSYYLEDQIEEENTTYTNKIEMNEDEHKTRNKGKSHLKGESMSRPEDVNVGRQPPIENNSPKKLDYYESAYRRENTESTPKKNNKKRNEPTERTSPNIVMYPRYPPYMYPSYHQKNIKEEEEHYIEEEYPTKQVVNQKPKSKRKFRQKNPNE